MRRAYQFTIALLVLVSFACRQEDEARARRADEPDIVSEGSVSGVTSTIVAPGETPVPLTPPTTDTNADTTTSFSILDTAMTGASPAEQPGTLADILPEEKEPRRIPPRAMPRSSTTTTTSEPPPSEPAPPSQPAPEPEPESDPEDEREQEEAREDEPESPAPETPPTTTEPNVQR